MRFFYLNTLLSQKYSVRFQQKTVMRMYNIVSDEYNLSVDVRFHGNRKARYANIKNLILPFLHDRRLFVL